MADNGKMGAQALKGEKRWGAGVIPYAKMGYYEPDYEPADSDILPHRLRFRRKLTKGDLMRLEAENILQSRVFNDDSDSDTESKSEPDKADEAGKAEEPAPAPAPG